MEDPERLAHLVAELSAHPGHATGERPFPHPVSDDDGVAIAEALAEEFDHGTARRAELAAAQGLHIHCKAGCSDCCTILVMIYRPEAARIARFLQQPENRAAREAFLAAYPAWHAAAGEAAAQASDHFVARRQSEYEAVHMAHWRKGVMCAFNHQGRCGIYPVRPVACRNAHALDTNAYCRPDAGRPAAAVSFVPLEEFLKQATRLLRATHNATSPHRHRQEPVCSAVHGLLTGSASPPTR